MSSIGHSSSTATATGTLSISTSLLWLGLTAMIAAGLYYFIGVDQGAVSVFGNNTYIHEFVHDARHLLGFPCH